MKNKLFLIGISLFLGITTTSCSLDDDEVLKPTVQSTGGEIDDNPQPDENE